MEESIFVPVIFSVHTYVPGMWCESAYLFFFKYTCICFSSFIYVKYIDTWYYKISEINMLNLYKIQIFSSALQYIDCCSILAFVLLCFQEENDEVVPDKAEEDWVTPKIPLSTQHAVYKSMGIQLFVTLVTCSGHVYRIFHCTYFMSFIYM